MSRQPSPTADSSERILFRLKSRGPQTVAELATYLDITSMGVRQHLQALAAEGLIASGAPVSPGGRGRPVTPWELTGDGHARFPDNHAQATVELIASVREVLGEAALDQVVAHRNAATLSSYQSDMADATDLLARASRLAELRSQEGYMAMVEQAGDAVLLHENHCPICSAATTCQGFCEGELAMFQQLFVGQATVTREAHLLAGARRCSYRITPV